MRPERVLLPLHMLPARIQPLVDPKQGGARRQAVARAAIPLPPAELTMALVFLAQDAEEAIASEARKSLGTMPEASLLLLLSSHETHAAVIDTLVRLFPDKANLLEKAMLNRVTSDSTVLWVATEGKGQILELISQNQARLTACPSLVKALYFNKNLRMATASWLMEFAVRSNLPIQDMPGYAEISAAIMGERGVQQAKQSEGEKEPPPPPPAEEEEGNEEILQNLLRTESEEELAALEEQLKGTEAAEEELKAEEAPKTEEEKVKGGSLYDMLREMSIPQRIRLALMGNVGARKLLAADSNRLVAGAVMRNPGLTEKEIALFAANRSANDEVIRIICNSREHMKNYRVKLGLVRNPKTPPGISASLMKHLLEKDLKTLSKSRDVPSTISRNAKRTLDERTAHRKE